MTRNHFGCILLNEYFTDSIIMKLRELRHNLWNLGFIEEGLADTLTNKNPKIHWVRKHIKDRWFADPFILNVTDSEIIILAEEYCYEVRRGRIARVIIDRKTYEEKDFEIILDLPTHLSFPFIIRREDKIYLMPENSASGCSTVYEYDDSTRKLTSLHHLAEEPFTDATIFDMNGMSYLCTTMQPETNSKSLKIYSFDKDNLKVVNRIANVEFPIVCGRNAGEVFEVGGHLYRPAQDCTLRYGHGVILQKMGMKDGEWMFENVNSLYPHTFKYNQGIHTFNNYKGLIVIDARGFRNPILGRVLTYIFKLIGKK